jgi:uncharacterized phiE125 gp8 family phage protein
MIDLPTAKAHLRVDGSDEDGLVTVYLAAAIGAIEKATSKYLTSHDVTQKFAGFRDCDQALRLWYGPVTDFPGPTIAYDDVNGVEQSLTSFRLVEGVNALLLPAYGAHWPQAKCAAGSVRVTYAAGYADNEVPPELDQAVLLLVGHYYANREAAIADTRAAAVELPLGVEALIAPYCAPGIA